MILKKISLFINYINLISCIFLAASAIYYTRFQQIGFYVFFTSYFFEIFLDKKWKNFHIDKSKIYYFILLLFFFLIFIYHPFENSNKYFYRLAELRLALFAFGVVGFLGVNKLFKVSYFANTFVLSSLIAILYIIWGIGPKEFILDPLRSNLVTLFRIDHINSHIVFNSYMNISLVCCWYLIFRTKTRFNVLRIIFYVITGASFTYFLVTSEGRIGIAICTGLLFYIASYQLWKIHKLLALIFIVVAPFIVWGVLSNHKRMSETEILNDPRTFIWKASTEVIKKQPIIGYGASRAQEEFDATLYRYETKVFREQWKTTKIMHCHNQFVQTYMEFGIIGIILLLGLISGPIMLTEPKRRIFAALLMFVFVSQFMTDIVITFQGFPVIFGILTLMTIGIKQEPRQTVETLPSH